jgi:hypothetical protein
MSVKFKPQKMLHHDELHIEPLTVNFLQACALPAGGCAAHREQAGWEVPGDGSRGAASSVLGVTFVKTLLHMPAILAASLGLPCSCATSTAYGHDK